MQRSSRYAFRRPDTQFVRLVFRIILATVRNYADQTQTTFKRREHACHIYSRENVAARYQDGMNWSSEKRLPRLPLRIWFNSYCFHETFVAWHWWPIYKQKLLLSEFTDKVLKFNLKATSLYSVTCADSCVTMQGLHYLHSDRYFQVAGWSVSVFVPLTNWDWPGLWLMKTMRFPYSTLVGNIKGKSPFRRTKR
jgi:hypothetical protein